MSEDFFEVMQLKKQKAELGQLLLINEKTQQFGLALTEAEAKELIVCRNNSLKKYQRVEFGQGILDALIDAFCDSQYIDQNNYVQTLERLQDIFYEFKNESMDQLTDDELMTFMREQFETICYGDLDYLEGTCLKRFAEAIRAGYRGYQKSGGRGEYEQFDEVPRWDKDLYLEVLKELCWR